MTVAYGTEAVGLHPLGDQKEKPDYNQPTLIHMSRNPSVEYHEVWYRGFPVPYLKAFRYPVDENGQQVFPIEMSEDCSVTTVTRHLGEYRWHLILDNRFIYPFTSRDEITSVIPMIADSMAIAAGYLCHGTNKRMNPHGLVE